MQLAIMDTLTRHVLNAVLYKIFLCVFDSTIVSIFMGRATGLGFAASAWKQGMKMILEKANANVVAQASILTEGDVVQVVKG